MSLITKTCTPCRGGISPLTLQQAQNLLVEAKEWSLIESGTKLRREFKCTDFASAWALVNRISNLSEAEGHHPDISFGWGYCHVVFQTHKIKGLHENDFIMASKVNALA